MLMNRRIFSTLDHDRLVAAVDRARGSWTTYAPNLNFFRAELRRAQALHPAEVPPDVITMNSRFTLRDGRTDDVIAYELVYPDDERPHRGKVSVLGPMGMAVFGAYVGDDVCWDSSDGPVVARVEEILYQPEADGRPAGGGAAGDASRSGIALKKKRSFPHEKKGFTAAVWRFLQRTGLRRARPGLVMPRRPPVLRVDRGANVGGRRRKSEHAVPGARDPSRRPERSKWHDGAETSPVQLERS